MKLYYSKGACSLAVRITLNELHLEFEEESIDLKQKKTEQGEDYLTINPKGSVPALQLPSGYVLTENATIHQFLADHYPSANLLSPTSQFKRYQALEWLNFIATDLHKTFSPFFNPALPHEIKDNFFKPTLMKKLELTNSHLEKNRFLLGEDYSLPDSYLFVILSWCDKVNIDLKKQFANLARYFQDLLERPAVKKSLDQEGLTKLLSASK